MSKLPIADISITQLKRGGRVLAEDIYFRWEDGQNYCITGPTGSGKTTLLKTIAGQIQQAKANICFPALQQHCELTHPKPYVSDLIAFVPQEISIPTIYIEDLYYQRRFQATEQADIPLTKNILLQQAARRSDLVTSASAIMQLDELLDQPFLQLSNGQTRRLMIALALVKQPKVLILDNPYAGLDKMARLELNNILADLTVEGIHLIMAAHEHEIANTHFISHHYALPPTEESFVEVKLAVSPDTIQLSGVILQLEEVTVRYGAKTLLNGLNWQVNAGDKWIISGRNGSGKSTLLSLIFADHPQAYSNRIFWMGRKRGSGESIWDIKRLVGYFSPELLRYYDQPLTVEEVIGSGLNDIIGQVRKNTPEELRCIKNMAAWIGIEKLLPVSFKALSAGEQRIVLLARAFIKHPPILILDEPLQGLDLAWRDRLRGKIAQFSEGKTMLFVTHDEEEIPEGKWKRLEL
jgi:molybdate transport system ATP-binding protein